MELFINLVFIALLLILVITVIRAPREIFGNLFRFVLSLPFRIIPFGSYIYRVYKADKEKQQETDNIKQTLSISNHPLVLRVSPKDSSAYLIIIGNYTKEIIRADLSNIFQRKRPELDINWNFIDKEDYTIIDFNNLPDLAVLMSSVKNMSKLYGTTNTYGYLTSEEFSFYCHSSNEYPDKLIGETDKGKAFFYSAITAKQDRNTLMLQHSVEINRKLSTDFFNQLVLGNSSHIINLKGHR